MRRIEPYTETKRELIGHALEALGPANDISTQWAMRRAIVRMAQTARDDQRDDGLTTRNELADELTGIVSDIQQLQRRFRRPGVVKGLFRASTRIELERHDDVLSRIGARHMERLPDALDRLPSDLLTLGIVAQTAIYQLGLKGRRGNVTPWYRLRLPAKVKFAAVGALLFQAARGLKRPPSPNNGRLAGFLAQVWEVATSEADVQDWTTPIRTARGKFASEETAAAVILARIEAVDLLKNAERWQEMHRLKIKRGAIPAKKHE